MASGDVLMEWEAIEARLPSSSFPSIDREGVLLTLDFPNSGDTSAYFAGRMPPFYTGGDIIVRIAWFAAEASTDSVNWEVGAVTFEPGDDVTGVLPTVTDSTSGASAGADLLNSTDVTIAFADAGSPEAGDLMLVIVNRDVADTIDTEARVFTVQLVEA